MRGPVIGVQLHHHVKFGDATRNLANAAICLQGVEKLTGDPAVGVLLGDLKTLTRQVSTLARESHERFLKLRQEDPETFRAARDGEIPWPDEIAEGFVARCSCGDTCLHERGYTEGVRCICGKVCPQHGEGADHARG